MSNIVLRRVIAYASEQGTSQALATSIGKSTGIDVIDIKNLKIDELNLYSMIVFVVSTYGRGAPPSNCTEYWGSLESCNIDCNTVNFAVLGVGSSNFRRSFLGFAKKLSDKMKSLGAKEVVPMGIHDETGEKSIDVQAWVQSIGLN